jgi:hypothetical protein
VIYQLLLMLVVLGVAVPLTAAVASVSASGLNRQQESYPEPLVVVESFLAARNAQDPWGAAAWCAPLLELQDVDGQWFVDPPTTSDWLRQLTARYLVDSISPPIVRSETVTWTERLTPRNRPFPEALASSISVDVSAVVRNGKIAHLSAPYPPLPIRSQARLADVAGTEGTSSAAPPIAPATLFIGSAAGLVLTVLLATRVGVSLGATLRRPLRVKGRESSPRLR